MRRAKSNVTRLPLNSGRCDPAEAECRLQGVESHERFVERYIFEDFDALTLERQNALSRAAFEIRFHLEMARVQLLNMERSKIEAGYSPFVEFSSHSWSKDEGFRGTSLEWRWTLSALGDSELTLPIRLPGITIRQGAIAPTKTVNPTEYARLWKEHRLDDYIRVRAE